MKQMTVTVSERPEETQSIQGTLDIKNGTLNTEIVYEPSGVYYVLKRGLDIALSLGGIIALLPVFLAVALCIKLDDGGSVLHLREIIGTRGKRFYALKFRTMIPNADEYLAKHPEILHR